MDLNPVGQSYFSLVRLLYNMKNIIIDMMCNIFTKSSVNNVQDEVNADDNLLKSELITQTTDSL